MSTPLNKAIWARLAGTENLSAYPVAAAQTALVARLGVDPDSVAGTPLPAVFWGTKNKAPVVYPCITFRPGAGSIDGRFASGIAMDRPTYDFEYWDDSTDESRVSDIDEYVMQLLDGRRAMGPDGSMLCPPLPVSAGKIFWAETVVPMTVLYDREINAWAGLVRYRFIEARF